MSSINIQAQACVACEGRPSPENTPCAVCGAGQPAASAEPVAWFIDWPDEPDLGHFLGEEPAEGARNRALVFRDAAPVSTEPCKTCAGSGCVPRPGNAGGVVACEDCRGGTDASVSAAISAEPVAWEHRFRTLNDDGLSGSEWGEWVPGRAPQLRSKSYEVQERPLCVAPVTAQAQPLSDHPFSSDWANYRQEVSDGMAEADAAAQGQQPVSSAGPLTLNEKRQILDDNRLPYDPQLAAVINQTEREVLKRAGAAQQDADNLDAERYRAWRDALITGKTDEHDFIRLVADSLPTSVGASRRPTAAEWDAAIDAARKKAGR